MVRHRVEWIGSGVDGLMQNSKGQGRSALWEMIAHQLHHSLGGSLTHSLAREKRDERGSRPRKTTTTRRREKREERREKRGERREKSEERRERCIVRSGRCEERSEK